MTNWHSPAIGRNDAVSQKATRINNLAAGVLAGALMFGATLANAQDFYEGRSIDLIVANTTGGGYDQYARHLARHIGRYIAGHPSIIVKNMPGAGGGRAANFLANVAPKDGTVLALLTREIGLAPLLTPNPANFQFDATAFNWIGTPQQDLGLFIINSRSPAQSIEEMKSKPITVSGTGPGSGPTVFPLVLNELLGTKIKVIPGYPGSPDALLAMERGEVDGHASGGSSAAFRSRIEPMIKSGQLKVVMQLGMDKDPAIDAPLVFEFVQNKADQQFLELIFTPQLIGRPVVAPSGVPEDRVSSLRTAFDKTMKDPEYLMDAQSQKLDIQPVSGAQIAEVVRRVYALPREMVERAQRLAK
ncbi:MAG: Bug family tripartite tricarboxylate transporter substrate binding protein [Beijerinckiaceae bacterium]